ncbi:PREDICTED: uncharacterized protein LOC104778826 [Camelina sativa]|uniref:Uncharacterized protein LOC104778826 n=1 Tax=Camelina sativa TaxID=90675 RepID=A0ABM0YIT1_CAMSA|nr:PREDICTED: uncharacterized protein LOC104778826 [Camelina sativa]
MSKKRRFLGKPPPKTSSLPPSSSHPHAAKTSLQSHVSCASVSEPNLKPPTAALPPPMLSGSKASSAPTSAIPVTEHPHSDLPPLDSVSKTQSLDLATPTQEDQVQSKPKPFWVDLLKDPAGSMSKKGETFILESGEMCVKIPNEVIIRNNKRWEPFIIGQFHGNLPPRGVLHAIFNGIWSNRHRDITISRLGPRTVLIRIPNSSTRQRILTQGMWLIEGQTMFVAPWEPGLNPELPELTEVPVWLEFRGVPPHFFSEEGFEHIAGILGQPIRCHQATIDMTNLEVGKVLTVINPSSPLPEAVNVQFSSGQIHRVTVSCPWLPPICKHCQEMGHSIRRCPTAPITCSSCNSSGHTLETCPKLRKGKTSDTKEMEPSVSKKDKRDKLKTKWVAKQSLPKSDSSEDLSKAKRLKKKKPIPPHSLVQVELDSPSRAATTGPSSSKKKQKPNKKIQEKSSSSEQDSSSDSSSIMSSASEAERSEEDETPYSLRRSLRKWLRLNKPAFGSIIETRVKFRKSQKYFHSVFPDWNFEGNYEFEELGRIWVVWDKRVRLHIHSKSGQMITCIVRMPNSPKEVVYSFIYAVNCKYGRQQLWDEIEELAKDPIISLKPWVAMGDFNQTLNPSESSIGSTKVTKGMLEFRSCLLNAGLFDLTTRGNSLTWWNKREANPIVKKLDRILVNDNWQLEFPLSYAYFGEPEMSDYCPSCLKLGVPHRSKKPFMVSHFLFQHKDFIPRVSEFWNSTTIEGTAMFRFSKKLKLLKRVIKDLNKQFYSDLENRVKESQADLAFHQARFLANPSPQLATLERQAQQKWFELALAEEKFLMQRSRIKWVESGDCNSAYFHRMINSRMGMNQIHYLVDDSGQRLEEIPEIQNHCVNFFTKMLGTSSKSISEEDKELIRSLSR